MHIILPIAIFAALGGCHPSSKDSKPFAHPQVMRHGEIEPDDALVLPSESIRSDQFLMGKDGPLVGCVKVKAGDVVTVTLTLWNRKAPRMVLMKPRTYEFPPSTRLEFDEFKDGMPAIPGGYDIIELKGLEQELTTGEERTVSVKIRFNSDKWQELNLNFYSPDNPPGNGPSSASMGIRANNPRDLAEYEWAMGRAKNPWPDRKK